MNSAFRNLLLWLAMFGLLGYGAVRLVRSFSGESAPGQSAPLPPASAAKAPPEPASPAPRAEEPPKTDTSPSMTVRLEAPPESPVPSPVIPADVNAPWPAEWVRWEEEVLKLVNERRAEGAVCGGKKMGPAKPLTMNEKLRRAARGHSLDMRKNNFSGHESSDGRDMGDRIKAEGYVARMRGENVARAPEPERVMAGWMSSPPHCANIMQPAYTEIGVGFVAPYSWTQNFGQGL